ncbi:MAG: sulfatase-like hydrolase/transferase [Clostridia bacterium]|nr:sulfatase-like hydrolase/transferase [Clostridia bacterium]
MKKLDKYLKFISITDRKRRFVLAGIVLAVCLLILLLCIPIFGDVRESSCVGNRTERSGVIHGEALVQRFIPTSSKVEYIELHYANCDTDLGYITFTVEDNKGVELYREVVNMSELSGDEYYTYYVNLTLKPNGTYYFKVLAEGMYNYAAPKLWISNNIKDEVRDVIYKGQNPDVRMQSNVTIGYSQFHYNSFFISIGCVILSAFTALLVFRFDDKKRRIFCAVILLLMPVVMYIVVELLNDQSLIKTPQAMIINYLLYLAIYLFFYSLTNRLRLTVMFSNILIFIIGIVNFYKLEFRGEPFTLSDIVSFKTAMNVASEYKIGIRYMIITAACIFMLIIAVVSRFRYEMKHKRTRVLVGILSVSVAIFLVNSLFNADRYSASKSSIMQKLGIVNNVWNQPKNYSDNGVLVALTMNAKYLVVNPPEMYSEVALDNITADLDATMGCTMSGSRNLSDFYRSRGVNYDKLPNIICIMDESYSDFSQFENLELSKEFNPFISSLSTNTIKGDCYVSTFGGGTANSEFEFLTGNSMAAMPQGSIPYQQYIDHETGSIVGILKNLGYGTYALHPYLESGWNRPAVYEYLGFDEFIAVDDFMDPKYIRSYISDECSFDKLIEIYENHEKENSDEPFFMFNVTMQNHGSYSKTYVNFTPDVEIVDDPGAYPEAEQYFSVARNTDDAVKNLIEYFENCDEPTIILFFGDHLPSFNDGFYEHIMGVKNTADLSQTEMQNLYITDYFIWANYAIQTPDIGCISLNYLSTLLFEVAGIPLSEYQLFLTNIHRVYPVLTTLGTCDASGEYIGGVESFNKSDLWNYYICLEHNNVFENENRRYWLFDYPFSMSLEMRDETIESVTAINREPSETEPSGPESTVGVTMPAPEETEIIEIAPGVTVITGIPSESSEVTGTGEGDIPAASGDGEVESTGDETSDFVSSGVGSETTGESVDESVGESIGENEPISTADY